MFKILNTARVLICVGSGGVGKTTLAASLGFMAAKQGRRVLVLTIDPSQRLKTTLNLSETGQISKLNHPEIKGEFSAAVIDAKKTFDEFVEKAAGSPELAQKILNNRLYQQLSTTLNGSQEFTALEKLYANYECKDFDLIILDTPPTKHAIDFLNAPQKLSVLFNEGVAKWFRKPKKGRNLISKIMHTGTLQVLKALESLTGSEFMHELADFFENIESWQSKLEERVTAVHRLLVHSDTHFCLVTSFDQAKLKEAAYFSKEIRKGGYRLTAVIINRAFPTWLARIKTGLEVKGDSWLERQFLDFRGYYQTRDQFYKVFAKDIIQQSQEAGIIHQLPEFDRDIANLDDVAELAICIEQGGRKI